VILGAVKAICFYHEADLCASGTVSFFGFFPPGHRPYGPVAGNQKRKNYPENPVDPV
jgi:hypothetical protein